jgi:hypothetical protein
MRVEHVPAHLTHDFTFTDSEHCRAVSAWAATHCIPCEFGDGLSITPETPALETSMLATAYLANQYATVSDRHGHRYPIALVLADRAKAAYYSTRQ